MVSKVKCYLNICKFFQRRTKSPPLQFFFADTSAEALRRWNRDHQPHRERLAP
jgi:hypothetical protein